MGIPQFASQENLAQDDEERITYFGITDTRGKHVPFGIKQKDRSRHTYAIGKTGMGKSNLLETMAIQDVQNGNGLCFIDPHGESADKILEYVPKDRIKDVVYFAPFDLQYPISFNVLEDVDSDKRHFVVAGLMSTFEKIWVDAWSARMAYILQNTIAALLEFPGATLLGVNRMYIDKEYRKNVVSHITDPSTRSFWVDEYTKYTDRYAQEATPAIQNKIGQFAANALVRNIIGQEQSAFDIRQLMDTKKIFIANLSKGRVGEGNANLIGSMLITKVYLAAMSRADVPLAEMRKLPPFYLYVDEFQNFANRSFADILSEARKYKLALTVAHQYIEQMEDEVRAAVFGNVGTMLSFRVGSYDAEVLEKEYAPIFTADDLVNLGRFQLYLKLMIDGVSSQPFSAGAMPPMDEPETSYRDQAIAFSRAQFARPRAEVEKGIADWTAKRFEDPEAEEKERARQERRAARDAAEGRPPRDRMQSSEFRPQGTRPPQRNNDRRTPPRRDNDRPASPRRDTRVERPTRDTNDRPRRVPDDRNERPMRPRPNDTRQGVPSQRPVAREEDRGESLRGMLSRMAEQNKAATPKTPAPNPGAQREANVDRPVTAPAPKKAPAPNQTPRPVSTPTPTPTPTPTQSPAAEPPKAPSLAPSRENGKGMSDEGKAQLRDLLSSFDKKNKSSDEHVDSSQKSTAPEKVESSQGTISNTVVIPPKKEKTVATHANTAPVTEPKVEKAAPPPPPAAQSKPTNAAPTNTAPAGADIPPEDLKRMLHVDKPKL